MFFNRIILLRLHQNQSISSKKKRAERDGIAINRTVYSPEDYVNACTNMMTFFDSAMERPQWAKLWLSDVDVVFPLCLAGATDENL